jgi:hypothetical protein
MTSLTDYYSGAGHVTQQSTLKAHIILNPLVNLKRSMLLFSKKKKQNKKQKKKNKENLSL